MILLLGTFVLTALCACAAWLDVSRRQLPNWLSVLTALLGLGFAGFEQGTLAAAWALAHALVALVIGGALFRVGAVGGGDGKFYAACAAWIPIQQGLPLLFAVSIAGFALAVAWFTLLRLRRRLDEEQKGKFGMLPYGLAIATGAVTTRAMGL